jgi:hypothetical protein
VVDLVLFLSHKPLVVVVFLDQNNDNIIKIVVIWSSYGNEKFGWGKIIWKLLKKKHE